MVGSLGYPGIPSPPAAPSTETPSMLTKILSVPFALVLFLLPGGWLGVELDDERPLTVKSVVEGSPAAKAGIRAGDVFQSVNGRRIRNEEALFEMFAGF